jgi:FtsZ-binding cell division protein ZapB
LRELVSAWPDDDPLAERLRDAIDRACDTIVLLQVEHGTAQAEDAARILYQLRTDFEQAMAA